MKKYSLFLLALFLIFLSACSGERTVSGEVTEVICDEDGGVVSFVVRTDDEQEVGILMTEETYIFSFADGTAANEFRNGAPSDTVVSVTCDRSKHSLTTTSGKEIAAYNAREVEITEFLTQEKAALPDGTSAEIWKSYRYSAYKLADGTELLRVQDPIGPNNVYVGGTENFDDLSEAAKKAVLAFYEEQGLLYDPQAELEKAYAGYLESKENGSAFDAHFVSQEISPTASSERVMYFLTAATLPIDGSHASELRLGTAFDRETGEAIRAWDLFSCSEEEAKQKILDLAGVTDPVLRVEMEAAFQPEYIVLFSENMEVTFPQGTLPSQEYSCGLGLDYDDALCAVLHAWAVPK